MRQIFDQKNDISRSKFSKMPKMYILKVLWPHTKPHQRKLHFFGILYDRLKAYWIFFATTFASSDANGFTQREGID